jgi:hypothetical protein
MKTTLLTPTRQGVNTARRGFLVAPLTGADTQNCSVNLYPMPLALLGR